MDLMRFQFVSVVWVETDPLHAGSPVGNVRFDLTYLVDNYTSMDDIGPALWERFVPSMRQIMPFTVEISAINKITVFAADAPIDEQYAPPPERGTDLVPLPMECSVYFKRSTGVAGPSQHGRSSIGPVGLNIMLAGTALTMIDTTNASLLEIASQQTKSFLTTGGASCYPVVFSRKLGTSAPCKLCSITPRLGTNRARRPYFSL